MTALHLVLAGAPSEASPPSAYGAWASLVVVGALAFGIVGAALLVVRFVTRVLDKIRDSKERLSTYECGEEPVGSPWFRFNNRFTTVALAFLVTDVELALMWPILPQFIDWLGAGKGTLILLETGAFAGTLLLGLAWVAAAGGFVWDAKVGSLPAAKREADHG